MSGVTTFFAMPVIVLLPFYVEDVLRVEADWYGWLSAAFGAGNLIGFAASGPVPSSGKLRGWLLLIFLVVQSAGYALLGLIRTPVLALAAVTIGGALGGFMTISITMLVQITTPSQIRGRLFGLLGSLSASLAPISMGLTGVITDLVNQNVPLVFIASGVIMTLITLAFYLSAPFREFVTTEYAVSSDTAATKRMQPQGAE
jgi:MFS family permease